MNKSLLKRLAIVTLVVFATLPLFAKQPADKNMHGDKDMPEQYDNSDNMHSQENGRPMGMEMMKVRTMGVVTSVDKDIITITDADGKNIQIHVNPFTRIIKQPLEMQQGSKEIPDEKQNGKPEGKQPDMASIQDITQDSWILVSSFDTGTTVIEARFIMLAAPAKK
jgi:hypothetical protein